MEVDHYLVAPVRMLVELDFNDGVWDLFVSRGDSDLNVLALDVLELHAAVELVLVKFLEAVEDVAGDALEDEVCLIVEVARITLAFLEDEILEVGTADLFRTIRCGGGRSRSHLCQLTE